MARTRTKSANRRARVTKRPVDLGDLERTIPFCPRWGNTRGGAIDRFYIDKFMAKHLRTAKGVILECGGDRYRGLIDPKNIESYQDIDIRPGCALHGDIQDMPAVTGESRDVIICTQVLQYVEQPARAIAEFHRVLRTGGRLLLSVPCIEQENPLHQDRWRFTVRAVRELLSAFRKKQVVSQGNLFSSVCFLMGLGKNDVRASVLRKAGAHFYQSVVAVATK
jgi:SAM-dependent methyltransferase